MIVAAKGLSNLAHHIVCGKMTTNPHNLQYSTLMATIGDDDDVWLQLPEFISSLASYLICQFGRGLKNNCPNNLFAQANNKLKDSGTCSCSTMMPLCNNCPVALQAMDFKSRAVLLLI